MRTPKPPKRILTGQRFGRLLVTDQWERRNGQIYWGCVCDCTATKTIQESSLMIGKTQSCGCLAIEKRAAALAARRAAAAPEPEPEPEPSRVRHFLIETSSGFWGIWHEESATQTIVSRSESVARQELDRIVRSERKERLPYNKTPVDRLIEKIDKGV